VGLNPTECWPLTVPGYFWEHAVHCKELSGFKYRHDFVRDVLFDIFRWAGVSVKKEEAPVNLLTGQLDRISTLRHADVTVYEWVRGNTHL